MALGQWPPLRPCLGWPGLWVDGTGRTCGSGAGRGHCGHPSGMRASSVRVGTGHSQLNLDTPEWQTAPGWGAGIVGWGWGRLVKAVLAYMQHPRTGHPDRSESGSSLSVVCRGASPPDGHTRSPLDPAAVETTSYPVCWPNWPTWRATAG